MSGKTAKMLRKLAREMIKEPKEGYQKIGKRSYTDKQGNKKTYEAYQAVNTQTRVERVLGDIYKNLPKKDRKNMEQIVKVK